MSFNQQIQKVISKKDHSLFFWTNNDLILEYSLRFSRILKIYSIRSILKNFDKRHNKIKIKDVEFNLIRKEFVVSDSTGRLLLFNESNPL